MECIVYQGFLQKTPPLDKLIVTWKKRWFVLSQRDPFDPRSVELTYYTDSTLTEKRGTINIPAITRIHPSPSKAKGHIFSIEIKDRKIMLKADDAKTKSIWIAKLYEFAGQGHNYHVTVPTQPMTQYNEGLLQLGRADSQLSIVPPTGSTPILNIPYSQIRRFGYQVVLEKYDVIWCELCKCHDCGEQEQDFCFFVVASGMDRAMLIAGDLKTKIEKNTGRFLIMEDDRHPECTYISRKHYGCAPYPKLGRERVLHAGLVNLEATKMVSFTAAMQRRQTEPTTPPLINCPNERRNTVQNLLGTKSPSPRHSPVPPSPLSRSPSPSRSPSRSTSPNPSGGTLLQDMTRRNHKGTAPPGSTSDPTADYSGQTLTAFDMGRRSDGAYLSMSDGSKSLSNWKAKHPSEGKFNSLERNHGNKLSLADLQVDRAAAASRTQEKFFPSKDSGIGTSADLVLDQDGRVTSPFHSPVQSPSPYSKGRKPSQAKGYDHLGPQKRPSQTGYDHLNGAEEHNSVKKTGTTSPNRPPIPPRSGVSLGDPYVDY